MKRIDYISHSPTRPVMGEGRVYRNKEKPRQFWVIRGRSKKTSQWVAWSHWFKDTENDETHIQRLRNVAKNLKKKRNFIFNPNKIDQRFNWVGSL